MSGIADYKFAAGDFTDKGIASLTGNSFVGQAATLKAKFDEIAKTMIALGNFNDLIDALLAVTDGASGADNIGLTAISGVTGATVQAALESLKTAIDGVALGTIPDASLTDTKLSDAANQIKQRISGKNLLHNWYFKNPVNQRGATSYNAAGYTVDRWKNANTYGTVAVHDGYITVSASGGMAYFSQPFENYANYYGKTYTSSVRCNNVSGTVAFGWQGYTTAITETTSEITFSRTQTPSVGVGVYFQLADGASIDIYNVKYELGSVSTLANDPLADYGEQLALCQRYADALSANYCRAVAYTANAITFIIPTPAQLRTNPTLTVAPAVNTLDLSAQTGFTFAYTAMSNGIKVVATKTSHGMTDATLAVSACIASADL